MKDLYLYPEEVLTKFKDKCDCEDISFTLASLDINKCGVCYGLYKNGNNIFGHAYPVFLFNNNLYIMEATGKIGFITGFNDKRYETYFIVTKNNTYRLKNGVSFGKIAEI